MKVLGPCLNCVFALLSPAEPLVASTFSHVKQLTERIKLEH